MADSLTSQRISEILSAINTDSLHSVIDTEVLEILSFLEKKFSEKLIPLALEKNIVIEDKYDRSDEFSFKEAKEFFDNKYNKEIQKDRPWILNLASKFVGKITSKRFVNKFSVCDILHYIAPLGREAAEKIMLWDIENKLFITDEGKREELLVKNRETLANNIKRAVALFKNMGKEGVKWVIVLYSEYFIEKV